MHLIKENRSHPTTLLLGVVALALAGAVMLSAPRPAEAVDLDVGHADAFHFRLEGQQLQLLFEFDSAGGEHFAAPGDVTMIVKTSAETTVPSGGAFSFLGSPGAPIWVLPQVQNPQLLWPGLSTEELDPAAWQGLQLQLLSVSGPGNIFLFQTDSFGNPIHLWDGAPDSFAVDPGSHVHFNWAFTAPGNYTLTVQGSGTHSQLGSLSTGPVTYHVNVLSNAAPSTPQPSATSPAAPGSGATVTPSSPSGDSTGSSSGSSVPPSQSSQPAGITPPGTGDAGLAVGSGRSERIVYLVAMAVALGGAGTWFALAVAT
jgi:surface-anchored protein